MERLASSAQITLFSKQKIGFGRIQLPPEYQAKSSRDLRLVSNVANRSLQVAVLGVRAIAIELYMV